LCRKVSIRRQPSWTMMDRPSQQPLDTSRIRYANPSARIVAVIIAEDVAKHTYRSGKDRPL
jgi:hypothetical protein